MMAILAQFLAFYGSVIAPEKIAWIRTPGAPQGRVTFEGVHYDASDHLECLGAMLSPDGTEQADLEARMSKATRAFWSNNAMFMQKSISIRYRVSALVALVLPILLQAAETLVLLPTTLRTLDNFWMRLVANTCNRPRFFEEGWIHWSIRRIRSARETMTNMGRELPSELLAKRKWKLARFLASNQIPTLLTLAGWRNRTWYWAYRGQGGRKQITLAKRGRVYWWEDALAKSFSGGTWKEDIENPLAKESNWPQFQDAMTPAPRVKINLVEAERRDNSYHANLQVPNP